MRFENYTIHFFKSLKTKTILVWPENVSSHFCDSHTNPHTTPTNTQIRLVLNNFAIRNFRWILKTFAVNPLPLNSVCDLLYFGNLQFRTELSQCSLFDGMSTDKRKKHSEPSKRNANTQFIFDNTVQNVFPSVVWWVFMLLSQHKSQPIIHK